VPDVIGGIIDEFDFREALNIPSKYTRRANRAASEFSIDAIEKPLHDRNAMCLSALERVITCAMVRPSVRLKNPCRLSKF
jgi:hypothetical protein